MKAVKINDAEYLKDFKISLLFNDNSKKVFDFKVLLKKSPFPNEKKYLDKNEFKKFVVDYGDLIWNNFDMCFQAKNLYRGKLRN